MSKKNVKNIKKRTNKDYNDERQYIQDSESYESNISVASTMSSRTQNFEEISQMVSMINDDISRMNDNNSIYYDNNSIMPPTNEQDVPQKKKRGRPRGVTNYKKKNNVEVKEQKQKRKYTKKIKIQTVGEDGETIIKMEPKKRGRKRGKSKKTVDTLFKPEEIIDYIIRNYPQKNLHEIRDKLIDGVKKMKEFNETSYLLEKFMYRNSAYYYDKYDVIFNSDGRMVGYYIKQTNGSKKIFQIKNVIIDTRPVNVIINDIECGRYGKNKKNIY